MTSQKGRSRRLVARYLAEHVGEGGLFSMSELIYVARMQTGIETVELDRRVRELRVVGWQMSNYRSDRTLRANQHRLVKIGDKIWEPGYQWPTGRISASGPLRRRVFLRDGQRCVHCGVRAGEIHFDEPKRTVRLTVGRIIPGSLGGKYELDNCQTECDRCNEDARDQYDLPEAA